MKRMISIALIILIVLFMFVPNKSEALVMGEGDTILTPEMVGRQTATWAYNFYLEHEVERDQTNYENVGKTGGTLRAEAYNAPIDNTTQYYMDCVGWISFAYHHAAGIGGSYFTIFGQPQRGNGTTAFNGFYEYRQFVRIYNEQDCINNGCLPGDILVKSVLSNGEHVGLYLGNDMVLHCVTGGVKLDTVNDFVYGGSSGKVIDFVVRITEETAKTANFAFIPDGVTLPNGGSTSSGFEFNGLPNNVSYSSSQDNLWLFDLISQFFGFFAGMMINLLKYSIIGYIEMAEAIANIFLQSTTESLSQVKDIEYAAVQYVDEYSLRCY